MVGSIHVSFTDSKCGQWQAAADMRIYRPCMQGFTRPHRRVKNRKIAVFGRTIFEIQSRNNVFINFRTAAGSSPSLIAAAAVTASPKGSLHDFSRS